MPIILIDSRSDSLTVSWPAIKGGGEGGATKYQLEYRTGGGGPEEEFVLLSDKLSQTQARKRNLTPGTNYFFRVAEAGSEDWIIHQEAFQTLTVEEEQNSMSAAPTVRNGGNQALIVSWEEKKNKKEEEEGGGGGLASSGGYELQMRKNEGGAEWETIAKSFSGTQVKKKNLTFAFGYQFRVRPAGLEGAFSKPSDSVVAMGLSQGIKRFFNTLDDGTLLRSGQKQQPVPLDEALGGKEFVLLYASAHWCPPCRQYTPQLANWYKMNRNYAEIVFLSCDHDENGFKNYFASHPWMAVDFEDDARENLLGAIRVSGIPRLVVLSGKTGRIIEDNAVGKPLDINRWRSLDR